MQKLGYTSVITLKDETLKDLRMPGRKVRRMTVLDQPTWRPSTSSKRVDCVRLEKPCLAQDARLADKVLRFKN
jgi:hypothetical protein